MHLSWTIGEIKQMEIKCFFLLPEKSEVLPSRRSAPYKVIFQFLPVVSLSKTLASSVPVREMFGTACLHR